MTPPAPILADRRPSPAGRRDWFVVALASGLFTVAVAGIMVAHHVRVPLTDPLKSAALVAAKEELRTRPADEALKNRIRLQDLGVRRGYFQRLHLNDLGAWFLAGGAVLFLIAAARARRPVVNLPIANGIYEPTERLQKEGRQARYAILLTALTVVLALSMAGAFTRTRVPESLAGLDELPGTDNSLNPQAAGPTSEEMLANWPRFRGPRGDGVATCTNPPLAWNGSNGTGIAWKVPVPLPGNNSPVLWGNRVFLSGGSEQSREVLCFDDATGDLLWQKQVPPPPGGFARKPDIPDHTGYAASTVATDGRSVFAIFGTGELAAFDFDGKLTWNKQLGVPDNAYGHATSLLVEQGKLLVQFDQGEATAGRSRLYAFEPNSGKTLWEQRRAVPSSWATPIVLAGNDAGPAQVITLGDPWLMAYDLADGRELWRARCLGPDLAPSPVGAAGLVVAVCPNKHVLAVRPEGQGDVTKTHVAWSFTDWVPDITSPVGTKELLFLLTSEGTLVCLDIHNGTQLWEQSLDLEFNASPALAGGRLYLTSTDGVTIIVAAERTFRELGRSELGEEVHASAAVVRDRIYFRGIDHLFCIGGATADQGR